MLIGAGLTLALGAGWSAASAADIHPVASAAARAAGGHDGALGGSTWRKAEEVPGTAVLNQGGTAVTNSLSCASAGNCSAGGFYTDGSGTTQAFVVGETRGTWGKTREVPGAAALGREASVDLLSCGSAGNCSAGGSYFDASGNTQLFVVTETKGTWGTAEEVPGTATLSQGTIFGAQLLSVSCASAGNCAAGGYYTDHSGDIVAFVVSETHGTWGASEEVPGTATLNQGGHATTVSVSCGAAGNCAAVGAYNAGAGRTQAFVVNETKGTWGLAEEVPGTAALNQGGNAVTNSVSCASARHCTAGGSYSGRSFRIQAFVVSQP